MGSPLPYDDWWDATCLCRAGTGVHALYAADDILLYHAAPGARYAEDLLDSERIRTLGGAFAEVSYDEWGAYIDDAQIVVTDIEADNGVIDVVLLPPVE